MTPLRPPLRLFSCFILLLIFHPLLLILSHGLSSSCSLCFLLFSSHFFCPLYRFSFLPLFSFGLSFVLTNFSSFSLLSTLSPSLMSLPLPLPSHSLYSYLSLSFSLPFHVFCPLSPSLLSTSCLSSLLSDSPIFSFLPFSFSFSPFSFPFRSPYHFSGGSGKCLIMGESGDTDERKGRGENTKGEKKRPLIKGDVKENIEQQ